MSGGPSASIRSQCPIATPSNDGLMSAAQALALANGGGGGGLPDPSIFPDGATPVVRNGVWVYNTRLTSDDIDPGFSVSASFSGTGADEVGSTVPQVSVTASYTNGPPDSATFTDGTHTVTLTSPFTTASLNNNGAGYSSNTLATTTFTLTSVKNGVSKSESGSLSFQERHYNGVTTVPGTFNSAFVNSLPNSAVGGSASGTYTLPNGDSTKFWFLVVPVSDPQPTSFTSSGFTFPMSLVASSISVTNPNGVAVLCNVYQSQGAVVVGTPVVVS